jgi:hypothetical protein
VKNEMVECEVHSKDLNEDVDLIDFSEPDEEIQEDIDIEDVNELPEHPTVACPLKYGVSKLTTAIFVARG